MELRATEWPLSESNGGGSFRGCALHPRAPWVLHQAELGPAAFLSPPWLQGYKVDLGSKKVADSVKNTSSAQYSRLGGDGALSGGGYGTVAQYEDDQHYGRPPSRSTAGTSSAAGDDWGGWDDAPASSAPEPRASGGIKKSGSASGSRQQQNGDWAGWDAHADSPTTAPATKQENDDWGKW